MNKEFLFREIRVLAEDMLDISQKAEHAYRDRIKEAERITEEEKAKASKEKRPARLIPMQGMNMSGLAEDLAFISMRLNLVRDYLAKGRPPAEVSRGPSSIS